MIVRYSNIFTIPYWEAKNLTSLSLTCKIEDEPSLIQVLSSLGSLRELDVRDLRGLYIWDNDIQSVQWLGLSQISSILTKIPRTFPPLRYGVQHRGVS